MILRTFGWSFFFTILGVLGALWYGGIEGIALALILIVLEISLSFDNAVVNAKVLERMSDFWQKIFLTVGILIAVFGMRLVFPFVVVALAASLSPVEVIDLALEKGDPDTPGTYGYYLADAHHTIAAFGGMFLLMIFLNFLFEEKDITWLSWIEKPLEKAGKIEALSIIVAVTTLFVAARTLGSEHEASVLTAGLAGLLTYLVVNGLAEAFGPDEEELEHLGEDASGNVMKVVGKAAFFLFLYLEVLDASFSFDGVIGAFAVTTDPIIIAIGLGVGAFYVRSVTIYLVHQGTLSDYRYLDHGAHWAIGALAALLIISIGYHVPEVITGLIGVAFIGAAFYMSIRANRRDGAAEDEGARDQILAP